MMSLRFRTLSAIPFFITIACSVRADTIPVIYINGIQNTQMQAAANLAAIRQVLSASPHYQGSNRHIFPVGLIWNPIGFYGSAVVGARWQDNKELFLLKTAEEKYADSFRKLLTPHYASSKDIDRVAAAEVKAYLDAPNMAPGGTTLEVSGDLPVDAMLATQRAVRALANAVKRQGRAVVIAHSQGNLLANLSYASLVEEFGDEAVSRIRIVNIANTSQFAASGLDFTHAEDRALKLLVKLPSGPGHLNWNRSTPNCPGFQACDFILTQPTFGAGTGYGDFFRHGIVETYMSSVDTVPVLDAQGVQFSRGANRFVDRFEDMVYAAANALRLPLTISIVGPGRVHSTDGDCQTSCVEYLARDQDVVLQALPDSGARFVSWSGDCMGESAQLVLRVDSARSCVAQFDGATPTPDQPRVSGEPVQSMSDSGVNPFNGVRFCFHSELFLVLGRTFPALPSPMPYYLYLQVAKATGDNVSYVEVEGTPCSTLGRLGLLESDCGGWEVLPEPFTIEDVPPPAEAEPQRLAWYEPFLGSPRVVIPGLGVSRVLSCELPD